MNKDKIKALATSLGEITKQHGKGAIMCLGDRPLEPVAGFSTGSPTLDQALGGNGYPRGRVVEIYGPEASGKTTLTLHAIAECQREGGLTAFIDAEHALDVEYAQALGVDPKSVYISQPDNGEQALDITESLVRSGAVDLVVVDSVAALVPQAEIDGDMGELQVGLQARLMSKAMRKLAGIANRTNTTIIFINQIRHKIGVSYGSPETTTGGNALKYYCSVRLDVRRIGPVKNGEELVGNRTRVKVVKNKLAPPFKRAEFDIRYGEGIDLLGDLIDQAVAAGTLEKSGAHYSFEGQRIAQGRERTRSVLKADAKLQAKIKAAAAGAGVKGKPKDKAA
ncbi:MAG: recombinase RecA [Myxococcota bacterium]